MVSLSFSLSRKTNSMEKKKSGEDIPYKNV
jgi:hypothetical protein